MLGKDSYKIENNVELSNDHVKSLSLFYRPMIGSHAFALYMNLVFTESFIGYKELNGLCTVMNISIDKLEESLSILNKYKLVRTLKSKKDEKYIFSTVCPLSCQEFINNDIYVRHFVMKVGGPIYQEITSSLNYSNGTYEDYEDISSKLENDVLEKWTKDDESYLKIDTNRTTYKINSLFDVNHFLNDVSAHLFPFKYRTVENLTAIAQLADLYNISYDKMRSYIVKVSKSESDTFDLKQLKYLCMSSISDFKKVDRGNYNVPCILFLMNLQEGKEVTDYDKKILFTLSNSYHLPASVINVLVEHSLKNSDNRLIEKYIYQLASDMHRNDIKNAEEAINRLDKFSNARSHKGEVKIPVEKIVNRTVDMSELDKFLKEIK